MMTDTKESTGIVLSCQSNFYTVKVDEVSYQCFLKGLLKKEGTDVLVGDWVVVDSLDTVNFSGRIIQVLARTSQLTRPKVANITRAMIVASIQSPSLDLVQLDRYLTHVRLAGIDPILCISKSDLSTGPSGVSSVSTIYQTLGIPVYSTSIQDKASVKALFSAVQGETVVLAGQSGVGKSSLLNAYHPGLCLAVGEVSGKIQRGQHTTRHVSLIPLEENTYIADTPGFSYLKFDAADPHQIKAVFSEFLSYQRHCRFDDCLHVEEEACAVRENLDKITPSRYESYRLFQEEAKAYLETVVTTSQKQEYGYKTVSRGKQDDLQILKLREKQRQASRRTMKQQIPDWDPEEDA